MLTGADSVSAVSWKKRDVLQDGQTGNGRTETVMRLLLLEGRVPFDPRVYLRRYILPLHQIRMRSEGLRGYHPLTVY